ncbi:hypothetical protein SAMD00024442_11_54 [Candidatus Symbiothrix dinenymphae]|nr:hypothetical protein SAMD00024442_11_54 [Candidatus Symbiothrix dinenymphae]
MNLIANTGLQFFSVPLEVNLNDNFKLYFYEWFDVAEEQLKLELAHNFSDDEIWVKKNDLSLLGYITDGKVGCLENGCFKAYKWEEIKNDFYSDGNQTITPMETESGETDCFPMTLNRCRLEMFENHWLPLPFFKLLENGKSEFGPTNWCRFKLIPDTTGDNVKKYNLLLAFDTRTKYEEEDFENEDLMETPVFASEYERSKNYALCNNEFCLVSFCSKQFNCEWVDEYLLNLFHKVKSIDELKIHKPKMSYLAQYIYLIRYIQQLNVLPHITFFSDKQVAFGNVDLVVDMGNSRTCAVLFDDSDFTKVEPLGLQNFSNPLENGNLNRRSDSFDMRLAFREADFGGSLIEGSAQFVFPSMVRLGVEANELIHKAINLNTGVEKITTFSSPKRYLWDNKPQEKEWEFVTLMGEQNKSIWIKGISEQVNADGSLNTDGSGGIVTYYSRKALMTFGLLEIFAQAKMQINSYEFRHKWGNENVPRRIERIIITCPTAMSRVEQIALRKCAEDAAIILERFYRGTYYKKIDECDARAQVKVIPSVKNLLNTEERKEWIYDEATCAQFVYLYAEITKRYCNNCNEYFDFYGKVRKDLGDYNKKSLTIGSVDIGAGTTDVMIAAYKYDNAGQCTLTPVPLFWESFYIAGDDLLKDLIRKLVIEGPYAAIQKQLEKSGTGNITKLILDFFGKDNARQSVTARQIRSEFNLQVSVPVVSRFLELLNENKEERATLTFDAIFANNRPTDRLLEYFEKHFGFKVETLQWNYDKEVVSKIVEQTFDTLAGKISTVLSYYGCDIVLLSGRPTSLKPLSDLFLKYYAVSPNRLITLNNYRIGTWYPFQNGKGYFKDAKSIVAVGAMIGNYAATRGSLDGFSLNLSELMKKMLPTTEYFAKAENDKPLISPEMNNAAIEVSQLPLRIWTRQLNSPSYPTRPFFILDFNEDKIADRMQGKLGLEDEEKQQIKDAVDREHERLRRLTPLKFHILRERYPEDKETLKIESVEDRNHEDLPAAYFSLQVQSMSEAESYWLDSGEFINLNITHN